MTPSGRSDGLACRVFQQGQGAGGGPLKRNDSEADASWLPVEGVASRKQADREEVSIDCLRGHRPAKTPRIPNVARRGSVDPRG